MKKWLTRVFLGMMMITMVGCGNSAGSTGTANGEPQEPAAEAPETAEGVEQPEGTEALSGELTIWSSGEELGRFVEGFNKVYPNIKVNITVIPNADFLAKLTPVMSSGQGAPQQ